MQLIIRDTRHARELIGRMHHLKNDPWEFPWRWFSPVKTEISTPMFVRIRLALFVSLVSIDCFPSKSWNISKSQVEKQTTLAENKNISDHISSYQLICISYAYQIISAHVSMSRVITLENITPQVFQSSPLEKLMDLSLTDSALRLRS